MTLNTKALREAAERATQPGPWSVIQQDPDGGAPASIVLDDNGMWVADCGTAPHDAAFIALANPATVIALLDLVVASQEENHRLRIAVTRLERELGQAAERIGELRLPAMQIAHVDDLNRCAVCGWALDSSLPVGSHTRSGCVRGNCSLRPRPAKLYAPERAEYEAASLRKAGQP